MADNKLRLSDAGLGKLKKYEGIIDGLYDDQSGYCTFDVGHLVHQRHKWKCFLLETAAADEAWKKYVLKKKWSGKANETPYLTRGAAFADKFDELKAKAIATTKPAIALKKFGKRFDNLTQPEKDEATAAAKDVVGNQAKVLAKSPDGVFHEDIKPFEKAVNDSIKAKLTQEEFDALVSLCFNIGVRAFSKSSVVREINKDKHKSGDAKQRKVAIDAIESAFGKFNKSGGKVSHGLTKRRKAEADSFLAAARAELARLEKEAVPLRLSPLK
jgi:GH24 family phage-related lysozyme (muramidase)